MNDKIFDQIRDSVRRAGEKLTEEFTRIDEEYQVTENLKRAARENGAEEFSRAAQAAEDAAREVLGTAREYYQRAEQTYSFSTQAAGLAGAVRDGYGHARQWVKENPGKTAVVTFSLIAGVRAGSALPSIGATILGAGEADNWFFHSALPVVGIRKLTDRYRDYLKAQNARLADGQLDEAERASLEFQRDLTRYVGAPLLGAFSVAAGASMIGSAFSGAALTGLPISLIFGGNPLLNGIWFFANGVICISEGYRFFMIALADEEEVVRVVREIKGLLPA